MRYFIDLFCVIFPLISNGCRGLDNIALNKTFRMRSVYPGFEGKEYRAVDGNRSQKIEQCTHTNSDNKNPTYVYVDIGYIANIYNVTIYYRERYEKRLDGYSLYYSERLFNELDLQQWNLCYKDKPFSDKPNGVVSQVCKGTARYVLVYQNNTSDPNENPILEICEIEIFGCKPGQFIQGGECKACPGTFCEMCGTDGVCLECTNKTYGYQCEKHCSGTCVGGCNISTGQCYECTSKTYGYQCEQICSETCVGGCNFSTGHCYGCNPRQFSKGKECIPCPGTFCADCSTDGICLECTNKTYVHQCEMNCSESCVGGCNISTGHCYSCNQGQFMKGGDCILCPGTFCSDCSTDGICLECTNQTYGYQCEKNCSVSCVGGCNISTGHCYACSPDKFGIFCNETCGQCREEPNKDRCDDITGICVSGCERGFSGRLCDEECNGTSFGYNCNKTCSETCKWTTDGTRLCNSSTGHCYSCVAGKRGVYCKEACSPNKFGIFCNETCGQCREEPDKDSCDDGTGTCVNGCEKGFTGKLCDEECNGTSFGYNCSETCSETCKLTADGTRLCNSSIGHCLNCVAGKRGVYCKEGCNAKTYGENCSRRCGHCLNGSGCNSVSGACAEGCDAGYQGIHCNETCHNKTFGSKCREICGHCRNDTACDPFSGSCKSGCEPGYQELTCKKTCGLCRHNTDCDQFNGTCSNGCQEGYQGEICNETCDINYYGEDCTFTCNEHCACAVPTPVSICHHVTGECLMGRKDGWIGKRCDSACSNGTFGQNCAWKCNEWCSGKSQSCDPRDGSCLNGCIPGFGGSHCNMYCDRGRYGKGCLNFCGYCFFKDCDHITGHCVHSEPLCEDGYRGANCDKVCESCTFGPDCRHNCSDRCYEGICILESKDIKNDSSQKELIKDLLPIIIWYISPIIIFLTLLTAYRLVKCCRRLKNRPSNSALY